MLKHTIRGVKSVNKSVKIYFNDFFEINSELLEDYGAFNVSLVNDLPLFIDPFLLFNSKKNEYQELHRDILKYLMFLKKKSETAEITKGQLKSWYMFPEIKQNWLGFSKRGNGGSGLGNDFATALHSNLNSLFNNFGDGEVSKSSHLEKLCIIKSGVGKDNISDFTTRLIHDYLLKFTQQFALTHLDEKFVKQVRVSNVRFNYTTSSWESDIFSLPFYNDDYVLLTPIDMLTRDDTWINKADVFKNYYQVVDSIDNDSLRSLIDNYFKEHIDKKSKQDERNEVISKIIMEFPLFIDYFIKFKEDHGDQAEKSSLEKVKDSEAIYLEAFKELSNLLQNNTDFYKKTEDTYEESYKRLMYLKQVIEHNDGYKIFYHKGKQMTKEDDIQILYRLTWFASIVDVNREVNNGRGPVDFKISDGHKDSTIIEFKLASNSKLKKNLEKQVEVYMQANQTSKHFKAIVFFTQQEEDRVRKILNELNLQGSPNVVLIDARNDNKPSASNA